MIGKVEKALKKGQKQEVQTIFANGMTSIKIDLRRISKVASGGEIVVRNKEGAEANFDYNSGKFELKPLAQRAEDIISKVNDVYFYVVKQESTESTQLDIDKLRSMFGDWLQATKSELKR